MSENELFLIEFYIVGLISMTVFVLLFDDGKINPIKNIKNFTKEDLLSIIMMGFGGYFVTIIVVLVIITVITDKLRGENE